MDCVSQVLEFYNSKVCTKEIEDRDKKSLYLSKLLIRVMSCFSEERINSSELRNCLLILVNLFSNVPGPDNYCSRGKNAQNLPIEEKVHFKEILLGEFGNN
jgi:hypothetical protein